MSTLFRARPKQLQDLPEWSLCCQEYIDATLSMPEIIIDRSKIRTETVCCNWCGHEKVNITGVVDINSPVSCCYVALDELEIDEKPFKFEES